VDIYPTLIHVDTEREWNFATEVASFETGYTQTRALWNHPMARFTLKYPILLEADYQTLFNFWLRHRGAYAAFRYNDPLDETPRARQFGIGDGTRTAFKLVHDFTSAPVVYVDGVADATAYVNPETGIVVLNTAPADGAILTYDADDAGYRCRFSADPISPTSLKYSAHEVDVVLEQVLSADDYYPISQVIYGGTATNHVLDTAGQACAFSFVAPKNMGADVVFLSLRSDTQPVGSLVHVKLSDDDDGKPGTVLATGDCPIGNNPAVWQGCTFSADHSLQAGVRYWLEVHFHYGTVDVNYRTGIPQSFGEAQDALPFGGYLATDNQHRNTPNSWLGFASSTDSGATWTTRDATKQGVFILSNGVADFMGNTAMPQSTTIYGAITTQMRFTIATSHDLTIDTVGGMFSSNGVPLDSLRYTIWVNGVSARTGVLDAPEDTGGVAIPMEVKLASPLTLEVGDVVLFQFSSASSGAAPCWRHYYYSLDSWWGDDTWDHDWDGLNWSGSPNLLGSFFLATPTSYAGAFTLRCRGWFE
jgi:uncharacterized protein (TIGR02217 family)